MSCSQLLHNLFTLWSWLVLYFFITCSQRFHDLLMTCSWFIHDLITTFSWLVHSFLMTCSQLSLSQPTPAKLGCYSLIITTVGICHTLPPPPNPQNSSLKLSITSLWLAHDLFMMKCLWVANDLFITCSWLAYYLFITYSQLFYNLFSIFWKLIQDLFKTCLPLSQSVHHLFKTCFVHDLFMINCLWLSHDLFMICS